MNIKAENLIPGNIVKGAILSGVVSSVEHVLEDETTDEGIYVVYVDDEDDFFEIGQEVGVEDWIVDLDGDEEEEYEQGVIDPLRQSWMS